MPGDELLRLGLITECVPDVEVLGRARSLCQRFAEFPTGAAATIKQAIIEQRGIEDPEQFFKNPGGSGLLGAKMLR